MIIIDNKLIDRAILEKDFVCNLSKCKGQCCVQGEGGAPLEEEEMNILDDVYEEVKPFLTREGIDVIEKEGKYVPNEKKGFSTPLINGGACAYLNYDDEGIAKCQIERAHEEGLVDFKKPISCHLYPIRVEKKDFFDHLKYFSWDICAAACKLGSELKVPVYRFLKEPIIRKYGVEFYKQLEGAADHIQSAKPKHNSEK